ncbi:transferase hexapeptide repeat containing protein [Paraburkholderia phymatum STM815]|uniref:Transferase hexapeptide repeat containing protein n=1 Tax=Paraburkholderia phymatum (strain DSM 17167 / CIP 108236 / LMG 21445 / STM815) TaxID=391038 RepID=B2JS08_PARP8|nr:transferase hexapeptide repeat containing protein [Paraburkholderia phymatum STM815]
MRRLSRAAIPHLKMVDLTEYVLLNTRDSLDFFDHAPCLHEHSNDRAARTIAGEIGSLALPSPVSNDFWCYAPVWIPQTESNELLGEIVAIYKLGEAIPTVHESVFVADSASLIGEVAVGENSSIWFGAVLRGDEDKITIGACSNVQENAVLHADDGFPIVVGENVTIGHQAMLHGCTIGDMTLVGMQAVVMNGAIIGKNCVVGAGALITEGKVFSEGMLILGAPAKAVRRLTNSEIGSLSLAALHYSKQRLRCKSELVRIG